MHNWKRRMMMFEADKGAGGSGAGNETGDSTSGGATNTKEDPQDWDAWLEGQPDAVKKLYGEHTAGLQSALKSERQQRGELSGQLQEASKKLEEGSEAKKLLDEQVSKLEEAEQRAAFYEDAVTPEIGCSNPKLAYLAAKDVGAFDQRGNVNWNALKKQFPELFKKKTAKGNAGDGAGGEAPEGGKDMNAFIRQATGR